jgi:hypothetical protein
LAGNQRNQVQEVVHPEMRAAGRHAREWIRRHRIGPGGCEAPYPAGVIVKVDALLAPGIAPLDQNELAPKEGMEGMDDPKNFLLVDCIICSWLLI